MVSLPLSNRGLFSLALFNRALFDRALFNPALFNRALMRHMMCAALLVITCGAVSGCVQERIEDGRQLQQLDVAYFRCTVEPVLIKRCAFSACHGSDLRPLRIYAPRRFRENNSSGSQLSDTERAANYDSARAMAGDADSPALLQLKPLATRAGGYFHRGQTLYGGGDVFDSVAAPGYKAIDDWAHGATADDACTTGMEVGP